MKKLFLILSCLMISTVVWAHKDRNLVIKSNGKIEGFAKKYGDIWFIVDQWQKGSTQKGARLKVGEKVLEIPACISSFIVKSQREKVSITGSWYHDLKAMPPYINISMPLRGQATKYSLLFDVKDAKLIILNKQTVIKNEGLEEVQGENIAPSAICNKEEMQTLNSLPKK